MNVAYTGDRTTDKGRVREIFRVGGGAQRLRKSGRRKSRRINKTISSSVFGKERTTHVLQKRRTKWILYNLRHDIFVIHKIERRLEGKNLA
jgi:hypothetical protein